MVISFNNALLCF